MADFIGQCPVVHARVNEWRQPSEVDPAGVVDHVLIDMCAQDLANEQVVSTETEPLLNAAFEVYRALINEGNCHLIARHGSPAGLGEFICVAAG